jgi:hypothetical protein
MKSLILSSFFACSLQLLVAQSSPPVPQSVVSDWTQHHILYPDSTDPSVMGQIRKDPRWLQNWYLRHREAWWRERHHWRGEGWREEERRRDWNVSLSASPSTSAFEPLFNFSYSIGSDAGYGTLTSTDNGNGVYLATGGDLTVTAGPVGTYSLYPGGPAQTTSPSGKFLYDDLLYPSVQPAINNNGPLFLGSGYEINIWSDASNVYEFDDYNGSSYTNDATGAPFELSIAPGGGQTFPAMFSYDVNGPPSCTSDFVVIGVPANPASGGQANIVGYNNLYSYQGSPVPPPPPLCTTNGPTVLFAYASGTGQVPAPLAISQNGTQLAYVENLISGSSYFHVLTIGTTGTNGTSPTSAVIPGSAGGNNAVDQRVLLSPDGGLTNQSSTNTAFILFTQNDANDVAYVTTYSTAGSGSGYLYKIVNVFDGSAVPTIRWSAPIDAVPSTPIYDSISNKVFFTDSNGRIDYVTDTGTSPSVVYGAVLASGTTSENAVTIDSTHQMVYATFNSNGTNAIVVQTPTSMASSVSVPVGEATNVFTGPYEPDFNNAWYTGSGRPMMFVAGTGTGTLPTLYGIGFNTSGVLNSSPYATTAPLATGTADSSPVTEFYNATLQKDFLFVGVTNNCVATTEGGSAGCVMSLDITNGFPNTNASATALPASGGVSGIVIDNDSSDGEASSIYYATKTGVTLVKATQSGLN